MKDALKLALEALERVNTVDDDCDILAPELADAVVEAITAIKKALAQPDYRAVKTYHEGKPVYVSQPEQESAATIIITRRGSRTTIDNHFSDCVRDWPAGEYKLVHATLPKRPWVGLTDEDYLNALDLHAYEGTDREFWKVLEAKLKEKNT